MSKGNVHWLATLESCEGADQLSVGMPDRIGLYGGGVDRQTDRVLIRVVAGAKTIASRFDLDELIAALRLAKQKLEDRERKHRRPEE